MLYIETAAITMLMDAIKYFMHFKGRRGSNSISIYLVHGPNKIICYSVYNRSNLNSKETMYFKYKHPDFYFSNGESLWLPGFIKFSLTL